MHVTTLRVDNTKYHSNSLSAFGDKTYEQAKAKEIDSSTSCGQYVAVWLTFSPHFCVLGPADMKSGHCEQTDSHRHKLWYIIAGNYRIIKHVWVNSFVDVNEALPSFCKRDNFQSTCRSLQGKLGRLVAGLAQRSIEFTPRRVLMSLIKVKYLAM
jgi:hypothetical protein